MAGWTPQKTGHLFFAALFFVSVSCFSRLPGAELPDGGAGDWHTGGGIEAAAFESGSQPPKIALVLSGGAALGLAHIGFLKVFEEVGIPVDIVIGNSMGGLVGGLYAAGYSPGDIQELVAAIDWNRIFSSGRGLSEKRLLDTQGTIFSLNFDDQGLANRNGFIPDQNITALFSRIVYRVSMVDDFSRLPRAFRALAVDLISGGEVTLERGSLYRAMRASMSIPVVFPPVKMEEAYLVDGGVLNNNPINVAAEWGADIIIDVNVNPFLSRSFEELESIVSVFDQTERLILHSSHSNTLWKDGADYKLDIDLYDFTKMDFSRYQQLIDCGEAAARQALPALLALAGTVAKKRELEPKDWMRRGEYFELPEPVFSQVRLLGNQDIPQHSLDSFFRDYFSQPVDLDKLERLIEDLRIRWGFETLGYHLEENTRPAVPPAGQNYTLVLTGTPAIRRNHELSLGLNFQISGGRSIFMTGSLRAGLMLRDITVPSSLAEIKLSYSFSQGLEAGLSYSHPLRPGFFIEPEISAGFFSSQILALDPQGELSTYGLINAGVNFSFMFRSRFTLRTGYRFSGSWYEKKDYHVGGRQETVLKTFSSFLHLAQLKMQWKSTESNLQLSSGYQGNFSLSFPFAGRENVAVKNFPWYEELVLYHRHFFSPVSARIFFLDIAAGSYRGALESRWTLFAPGGKNGIPGFSSEESHGRDKIILGFGYMEEIKPLTRLLGYKAFFSLVARGGNAWEELEDFRTLRDLKAGFRLGVEVETPLGNLFMGPEVSLDGRIQVSLFFN